MISVATNNKRHFIGSAGRGETGTREGNYVSASFKFQLDVESGIPIYRQLVDQILVAIATGHLTSGDRLPSVRQIAADLSIRPNSVIRAYKQLEKRGMLLRQPGIGLVFICVKKGDKAKRQKRLSQIVLEFVVLVSAEGYTVDDIVGHLRKLSGRLQP
jgi:GntR family transcriptional regulator